MDDNDDFDDIADEDLVLAFNQTSNSTLAAPASARLSLGSRPRQNPWSSVRNDAGRPQPGQGLETFSRNPSGGTSQTISGSHRSSAQVVDGDDLEGISSDAFDSSAERGDHLNSPVRRPAAVSQLLQRSFGRSQSFRQTTLFGNTVDDAEPAQPQTSFTRAFRADLPPEAPTHHALDHEALKTWVYPLNLGVIRDYQFSIVKNGLFNNTLVALPTGLGKTFIAAAIILNYYRWTRKAKIVFVAPTKPLAAQQVEACLNIAGIPRSQSTLLTGETQPVLREAEWEAKRLFFMTPQTLMNDLSKGYADPKSIVLLVVDEAHRATGDYAYVKVVQFIRRFSTSFRVLALTATPGSSVESVQEVIDSLGISHVEIRTEESMDIRQYVHHRSIDTELLEPSEELLRIRDMFSKALKPLVDKLTQQNIWWGRDPMSITTYGLLKQRADWMSQRGRHVNQAVKFMMMSIFAVLQTLAHSIKLLNFHGIKPFYDNLVAFRGEAEGRGENGSKYKRQLVNDPNFQEMMSMVERWLKLDGFVGHPKMTYLCDKLLNHFMDAGEGSSTRAIVFSEYRDSAEEIVRVLNKHRPMISATVFVGQADSKKSEGMKQKQQIETIEKFKSGAFNVLVATSIGEEGLDIGQVDLIICYDASASPIRMLQRMGRTGRKRAGNILLLLMKGKEEEQFAKAKDNYEQMQKLICEGSRFNFRHDISVRIVPRDVRPEVDKRHVDIPPENSQDTSLPEPKKRGAGPRKKPAKKKFNMPDGVETGFQRASVFGLAQAAKPKHVEPKETDYLAEIPPMENVVPGNIQTRERRRYSALPSHQANAEIEMLNLCLHPAYQRALMPTVKLGHGAYTKRCVKLFKTLSKSQGTAERYVKPYGERDSSRYKKLPVRVFAPDTDEEDERGSDHIGDSRKRRRQSVAASGEDIEEALPRKRKKPPAKPKTHSAIKGRKSIEVFNLSGRVAHETDGEEEDADDAPSITPPRRGPGRPRKSGVRGGRGGKGSRSRGRLKRSGDHLEDLGDDCTRTSDMEETDGSDSGADLADFIVGDDEVTSSMLRPPHTSPTTLSPCAPTSSAQSTTQGVVEKPYFMPMRFSQRTCSDDDLPDISELRGVKKAWDRRAPSSTRGLDGEESEDVVPRPAARRKRRAAVVDDSDGEQ